MHRFVCLGLFSYCLAALGQTPTAEQILSAYVNGIGGADKVRAVKTIAMKGTLDNPDDGSKVPVEVQAKAPNLYSRTTRYSESAVYRTVFAGDAGWNQDPDNGVRPMNKSDVGNCRLDYDMYRPARLAELYPKLGEPKTAKLAGKDVWSLEAATPSGSAETWWFDPNTKLLLCREYERISLEDGILRIQEFYDDYREVDGVKFPATVRQVMPDYELRYHFDDVKLNPPLEDSLFAKPQ